MDRTFTLSCCGGKKCPDVILHDDGNVTLLDEVDGEWHKIELSPEQAEMLYDVLGKRS
jgi:hypothetical protein